MYFLIRKNFIWNGDDIYYQVQRITGIDHFIHVGTFPTISTINFGEIGYGVNLFYPWITLVPFGLINLFSNNIITTYYLTIGFFFFLSFLISHYSMYKFSHSNLQAVAFSLIYNFCNYRLIELIPRSSLAEYIATIFLPLCFLGLYEVLFKNYRNWFILTIGMTFIVMTHILTTFMTVVLFFIILLCSWFKLNHKIKRVISLIYAAVSTFLLSAVFLIPFLLEEKFQKYAQPDPQRLIGTDFWQSIIMGLNNSSSRMVEGNYYNLGVVLIVVMVMGLVAFKKMDWTNKFVYLLGVGIFLFSTNLFPWQILQNTFLNVIQFPFRLLMFASLFLSVTGSYLFKTYLINQNSNKQIFSIIALLVILFGFWSSSFKVSTTNKTLIADSHAVINNKMIRENRIPDTYLDQYVPAKSKKFMVGVTQHQVLINNQPTVAHPLEKSGCESINLSNLRKNDNVDMPFIKYKYSNVLVNGRPVNNYSSQRGTIEFHNSNRIKHAHITVDYGSHKLFATIIVCELLGLISIIAGIIFKNKSFN
ncbi:hypothetical protein CPR19088_GLDEOEPO_00432 [Companilactobacillus paralimentarius]